MCESSGCICLDINYDLVCTCINDPFIKMIDCLLNILKAMRMYPGFEYNTEKEVDIKNKIKTITYITMKWPMY